MATVQPGKICFSFQPVTSDLRRPFSVTPYNQLEAYCERIAARVFVSLSGIAKEDTDHVLSCEKE
jgi:hypothetical protein